MVRAKKKYGQNFLNDSVVLRQIVDAADIQEGEQIVEIGPGMGALTEPLLAAGAKVEAVEIDEDLIPSLQATFGSNDNFKLINQDALTYEAPKVPYKLVANIPYYITSPLINHFLLEQFLDEKKVAPSTIVIMVQKEVAEKIIAKKGSKPEKHSVLSLQVHLFGDVEWVCEAPSSSFDPAPKVDSAVIKINVAEQPKIQGDLKKIFWLFNVSFTNKRKKLAKNLAAVLRMKPAEIKEVLSTLDIDPEARAEALSLDNWKALYGYFESSVLENTRTR